MGSPDWHVTYMFNIHLRTDPALGPALFLIDINDLGEGIIFIVRLFADDTFFYSDIRTPASYGTTSQHWNHGKGGSKHPAT